MPNTKIHIFVHFLCNQWLTRKFRKCCLLWNDANTLYKKCIIHLNTTRSPIWPWWTGCCTWFFAAGYFMIEATSVLDSHGFHHLVEAFVEKCHRNIFQLLNFLHYYLVINFLLNTETCLCKCYIWDKHLWCNHVFQKFHVLDPTPLLIFLSRASWLFHKLPVF